MAFARRVTFALVAASAFAAAPARADDTEDLPSLLNESVVTGASKEAETAADAPATVSVLTSEDMRRFGMRSLNEAIDFLSMGFVTQDPLHSVEIGGRGVLLTSDYGNHVLVVVDGHSINEQWDGTTYYEQGLGIPLELIDHVELILGPGSVLYGGYAMLGVINVVTKTARAYKGWHLVGEAGASPEQRQGSFASFAPSNLGFSTRVGTGFGAETRLLGKPLELVGQIEMYSQDGPSFSWGPQTYVNPDGTPVNYGPGQPLGTWGGTTHNSYYTRVPTGHVRATWGDFTATLHAQSYVRATPYTGFNQSVANFDDPSSYEVDRWLWGDVKWSRHVGQRLAVSARAYADSYDYQQRLTISDPYWCPLATVGTCYSHLIGVSRWAGLELQATEDWLGDDRLTTMVGVDPRVRFVGTKLDTIDGATGQNQGSTGAGHTTEVPLAVYVQQRWSPWKALHLNGGARFDEDPRGGSHLSPRAAATWDAWQGGTFKTIYSEAFRSPTYYEYYYSEATQIANPALKAETVRSVEASVEQRFGGQRVLFGAFRSWWHDMVSLEIVDLASAIYQYRNASSIDNYGFNGLFEGSRGPVRYGLSVTGAHTRRNTESGPVPLTVSPSIFGNARVSYDLPGKLPVLAVATSVTGPRLADRALDGGFPTLPVAPTQLRVRVTASGDLPIVPGLSYRLSCDYATASHAPYVAGPNQSVDPTLPDRPHAELAPVNRLTVFATLQYDLVP